jgi:phosphatidylethanolamine-binding protein (PEBP) family uncharacterized protein
MPSITITSSFASGIQIPVVHRSAFCSGSNQSPLLQWSLSNDVDPNAVISYSITCIDTNAAGTGPNGKFLHWKVEDIPNTVTSIGANANFPASVTIFPTDYGSGDRSNGWNGPCAPEPTHYYEIIVEATVPYLQDPISGTFQFTDNPEVRASLGSATGETSEETSNTSASSSSGTETTSNTLPPCGSIGCPEGYTLTPEGICQQINIESPTISETQYTVCGGDDLQVYSEFGTRFYDCADNYTLPLRTDPSEVVATGQGVLKESGTNTDIPFVLVQDGTAVLPDEPVWENPNSFTDGRLNIAGIWTCEPDNITPCPGSPAPPREWIGFSRCVEVPATKKYCIGLAADNRQRFSVNGQLIAEWTTDNTRNFKYWNVIEITLNAGTNYIEVEGWNERCTNASFAAEIYNATSLELQAITTLADLEPLILFTTRDLIGTEAGFDIGENSGAVCTDGFAFDACDTGDCIQILTTDTIATECCWIIENCENPDDVYAIQLVDGQPDVTIGNVFEFAGDDIFTGTCYQVTGEENCEIPDFTNLTIVTDYGPDNCLACSPSEEFESCSKPGSFVYVSLPNFQGTLVIGNVYRLSAYDDDCYTYVGLSEEVAPQQATDITDLSTDYCLICEPCYEFEACSTGSRIFVRFSEGIQPPPVNQITNLGGDPALEDECWKYIGEAECDQGDENYLDVSITKDYACQDCDVCKELYKLTECCGTATYVIEWSKDAEPLDETQTYIFDFAPDTCFSVEHIPTLCGEDQESQLPTAPTTWKSTACAYGMYNSLGWVFESEEFADVPISISSLRINGTEYITPGNEYDIADLPVNIVPANNFYGQTYTNQVDGINALLTSLGLDNLVKAQVVTNDVWATAAIEGGNSPGAFYLILAESVETFTITFDDNVGWTKTIDIDGGLILYNATGTDTNPALGYEFVTCININEEPFTVNSNGVVEEPPF